MVDQKLELIIVVLGVNEHRHLIKVDLLPNLTFLDRELEGERLRLVQVSFEVAHDFMELNPLLLVEHCL